MRLLRFMSEDTFIAVIIGTLITVDFAIVWLLLAK
jgi:hypothetical protein